MERLVLQLRAAGFIGDAGRIAIVAEGLLANDVCTISDMAG